MWLTNGCTTFNRVEYYSNVHRLGLGLCHAVFSSLVRTEQDQSRRFLLWDGIKVARPDRHFAGRGWTVGLQSGSDKNAPLFSTSPRYDTKYDSKTFPTSYRVWNFVKYQQPRRGGI